MTKIANKIISILIILSIFFSYSAEVFATMEELGEIKSIDEEVVDIQEEIPSETELEDVELLNNVNLENESLEILEPTKTSGLENYIGAMCIDAPTPTSVYEKPEEEYILLRGWAISTDSESYLKVYVNGVHWSTLKIDRTSRPDVDKAFGNTYGGTATTPKAGFEAKIGLSGFNENTHTIKVEQVDRTGRIISSSTVKAVVKYKIYAGTMCIDAPTPTSVYEKPEEEYILLRGWAISTDSESYLKVYVNGVHWSTLKIDRTSRPDVDKAFGNTYGGTETTPKAGFEAKIGLSGFNENTHTIKVEQVDRTGRIISSSTVKAVVKYKIYTGAMCIDSPTNNATVNIQDSTSYFTLRGWAISTDSKASLKVYVNGVYWSTLKIDRTSRPDVDKAFGNTYGGTAKTPRAGFEAKIGLSGFNENTHTVKVEQVDALGRILNSITINIKVNTPMYTSEMCIDTPQSYQRMKTGALVIKGWAVSFDPATEKAKIYIDGKYIIDAARISRPDVDAAVSGSFGGKSINPLAGFHSEVSTVGLSEGIHTVRVDIVSHYGKVINSKSVKIFISNNTYFGVDVSHWNGNVNWAQLKSEGVEFAILKIGQYSESTKTFRADPMFETNYVECKKLGIKVGGYIYSYAFNAQEGTTEASECLKYIKGKTFEYPIFIDTEDKIVTDAFISGVTNKAQLTAACKSFCDTIIAGGYKAGVYSYKSFFQTFLNMEALSGYNIWLAHWGTSQSDYVGRYDIWQYTDEGKLQGNGSTYIDLNLSYVNY